MLWCWGQAPCAPRAVAVGSHMGPQHAPCPAVPPAGGGRGDGAAVRACARLGAKIVRLCGREAGSDSPVAPKYPFLWRNRLFPPLLALKRALEGSPPNCSLLLVVLQRERAHVPHGRALFCTEKAGGASGHHERALISPPKHAESCWGERVKAELQGDVAAPSLSGGCS